MTTPAFANLKEAFLYCRDMDALLSERLDAFSAASQYLSPGYQEALDRLVSRLKDYDAGQALKLSFLMSIPASLAANLGLFFIEGIPSLNNWMIISAIASFVASYLFIKLLLGLVRKTEFWRLCILLGAIAILAFIPSLLSLL